MRFSAIASGPRKTFRQRKNHKTRLRSLRAGQIPFEPEQKIIKKIQDLSNKGLKITERPANLPKKPKRTTKNAVDLSNKTARPLKKLRDLSKKEEITTKKGCDLLKSHRKIVK
jgi:hypothetical protein